MRKFIRYIFIIAFASLLFSCSGLDQFKYKSSVKEHDGYVVSTFYSERHWQVNNPEDFTVKLIGVNTGGNFELKAKCEFEKKYMKVSMNIPSSYQIPNDEYVVVSDHFPSTSPVRYLLVIIEGKVTFIDDVTVDYSSYLSGYGTGSSPYLISSTEDFNNFLFVLGEDEYNAKGIYFRQEGDFTWSSGTNEDNRSLGNLTFAGNYNGNSKTISNLYYNGAGSSPNDDSRGIFKALGNGAVISNLNIDDISISKAYNKVGAIAGEISGEVSLINVSVSGTVNANSIVGGFIGYVGESSVLNLNNCRTNIQINNGSGDDVGGAIGLVENGKVYIWDFQTLSYDKSTPFSEKFAVYAANNAGGVIGRVKNSQFDIGKVTLMHSTNTSNDDVKIVYSSNYAGGLIGRVESTSGDCFISYSDLVLNVQAESDYCGGYIGRMDINHKVTMEENDFCGPLNGQQYVGGAVGYLNMNGEELYFLGYEFKAHEGIQSPYYSKGKKYIGGLIGYVLGENKSDSYLSISNVKIAANVISPQESEDYGYVGGLYGYITNVEARIISSTVGTGSVEISGPFKVGGLIGEISSSNLYSDNTFDMSGSSPKIPSKSSFYHNFYGDVRPYNQCAARYIGGAIGNMVDSEVSGIHVQANVTGGGNYTGGVVGFISHSNDYKLKNCTFSGIVRGRSYAGGVVGEVEKKGKVEECINYGDVYGERYLGGIVGYIQYSSDEPYVNYCVNIGSVTGTKYVGGVAGAMSSSEYQAWCSIHNCANYGTITGNSDESSPYSGVGGILGKSIDLYGNVQYCVNFGKVTGSGENVCVGGIAGKMGDSTPQYKLNVSLRECANYGEVSSSESSSYLGGIIGYLEDGIYDNPYNSAVENCYNSGSIPSDVDENTGGIVGLAANHSMTAKCVNYGNVPYGNGIMGTDEGNGEYEDCYTLEGTYISGDVWPKSVHVFTASQMSDSNYWEKETSLNMSETWRMNNGRAELTKCPFQYVSAPTN